MAIKDVCRVFVSLVTYFNAIPTLAFVAVSVTSGFPGRDQDIWSFIVGGIGVIHLVLSMFPSIVLYEKGRVSSIVCLIISIVTGVGLGYSFNQVAYHASPSGVGP